MPAVSSTATRSSAGLGLFLGEPRAFARSFSQIIQFRAPDFAARHHFDLLDARRVERKDALDAEAVGDLPDGEVGAVSFAGDADHDAFEDLGPLLFSLDDFDVHPDGLARADRKSTRLNSSHIPLSRMPSS